MKKLLILFVAFLGISPAFAQSDEGVDFGSFEKPKKSAFFIGPKAGVTMSSMTSLMNVIYMMALVSVSLVA